MSKLKELLISPESLIKTIALIGLIEIICGLGLKISGNSGSLSHTLIMSGSSFLVGSLYALNSEHNNS